VLSWFILVVRGPRVDCLLLVVVSELISWSWPVSSYVGKNWRSECLWHRVPCSFSPRAIYPFSGDPPSRAATMAAPWPVSMDGGGPRLALAGTSVIEREDWVRWT
jgi:hypothetical protein